MEAIRDYFLERFQNGEYWLADSPTGLEGTVPSADIEAARRALRAMFPWAWCHRELCRGRIHPVVRDQLHHNSLAQLFMIGGLLARNPQLARVARRKLRNPTEYYDTLAELYLFALVQRTGARVDYEPQGAGNSKLDLVARWEDLVAFFEIKRPRVSERAATDSDVALVFVMELGKALADELPTAPAELTVQLHRAFLDRCGAGCWIDWAYVRAQASRTAQELRVKLPKPTRSARIDFADVGLFVLERRSAGALTYQLVGAGDEPDVVGETKKLAGTLRRAAGQLGDVDGVRLAVLHAGGDALIHNYRDQIQELLHGESWARPLDAVLLFDPYCMVGGNSWELVAAREGSPRVTAVFERLARRAA